MDWWLDMRITSMLDKSIASKLAVSYCKSSMHHTITHDDAYITSGSGRNDIIDYILLCTTCCVFIIIAFNLASLWRILFINYDENQVNEQHHKHSLVYHTSYDDGRWMSSEQSIMILMPCHCSIIHDGVPFTYNDRWPPSACTRILISLFFSYWWSDLWLQLLACHWWFEVCYREVRPTKRK